MINFVFMICQTPFLFLVWLLHHTSFYLGWIRENHLRIIGIMYEDLSVAYLDIEREADLLLSGLAMATRSTGSMMHVLSTGKQSNEADRLTRDNSTPSSAGSERIHSPDGFGERQGASLSPSRVKPALSDEEAALEREIRLLSVSNFNSGEMSGFDVNKRSCENVSCPKDGSKDLETKKNLKKLANRWKHFADSYGR